MAAFSSSAFLLFIRYTFDLGELREVYGAPYTEQIFKIIFLRDETSRVKTLFCISDKNLSSREELPWSDTLYPRVYVHTHVHTHVHTRKMAYSVGAPSALSFLFLVPLLYRHGRKETKEGEEDEQSGRKNTGEERKESGGEKSRKLAGCQACWAPRPGERKANEKGDGLSEAGKSSLRFEPGADRPTVRPTDRPTDRPTAIHIATPLHSRLGPGLVVACCILSAEYFRSRRVQSLSLACRCNRILVFPPINRRSRFPRFLCRGFRAPGKLGCNPAPVPPLNASQDRIKPRKHYFLPLLFPLFFLFFFFLLFFLDINTHTHMHAHYVALSRYNVWEKREGPDFIRWLKRRT